jgi:hypothetical protein
VLLNADIQTHAAEFWKDFRLVSSEVLCPKKIAMRPQEAPLTLKEMAKKTDFSADTIKDCANSPAASGRVYLCSPVYTNIQTASSNADPYR